MAATQRIATTHTLIEHKLVIYKRERSAVWQCRFSVDGRWQRTTTHLRNLAEAKARAHELLIEANVKKKMNVAPITRAFRDVAKLAIKRMEKELAEGTGKVTYNDYISVIKNYLSPYFGKHSVNSIDAKLLAEYDDWRVMRMGKTPLRSTVITHNAALNRIFDEAEIHGFMYASNRPKLITKGQQGQRRDEFSLKEIQALCNNFDAWIARGRADSIALRQLLRDYVMVLLDTGARPGKELLDLTWAQLELENFPTVQATGVMEVREEGGEPEEIFAANLNRTVYMRIMTGKTSKKGGRTIVGRTPTARALEAISKRNYGRDLKGQLAKKIKDRVFMYEEYIDRKKDKTERKANLLPPTSFSKLFDAYLTEHNLLIDPATSKHRVFYSLRHTYATLALTHDKVSIHTLAKQMGTSVGMIERHYSHLDSVRAVQQLRGDESRQLIEATGAVDKLYQYTPPSTAKAKKSAVKKSTKK
jgi:integrase